MKTGNQSNVFDYNTGSVNTSEVVPQDFRIEKPPFSTVPIDLQNETFEERLYRLGKVRRKDGKSPEVDSGISDSRTTGMSEKMQGKLPGRDYPDYEQ